MIIDTFNRYILFSAVLHFVCAITIIGLTSGSEETQYNPIRVKIISLKQQAKEISDPEKTSLSSNITQKIIQKKRTAHRHKNLTVGNLSSEKIKVANTDSINTFEVSAYHPANKKDKGVIPKKIQLPVKKNKKRHGRVKAEQGEPHKEQKEIFDKPIPLDTKDIRYSEYFASIRRKIEKKWSYPEEAAMLGLSGKLKLKFIVGQSGKLIKIKLVDSSGSNILDDEAADAVKEAAPYNPIPENIKKTRLPIIATFNYFSSYDDVGY